MSIITSIETYFERVLGGTEKKAVILEQEVIDFLTPLGQQIQATALTLGKQDLTAGLKVLKDAVTTAVAAGATAAATGASPVAAAEAAFLTTGAAEGQTALNNAEAGAIKAGVAIAQQAAAELAGNAAPTAAADTPTTAG